MPYCAPGEVFSSNPNAPCLNPAGYIRRKLEFTALMIGVILYGVTIALFFQSLRALFYPMKGRVTWGLVTHTVAMFLCLTISVTTELSQLAPFYIDDREYPQFTASMGILEPWEYLWGSDWPAMSILSNLMFPLNQWLADGLLLYRCYIIYAGNYLVIFPCLMYLATVVIGAMYLCGIIGGEMGSTRCFSYNLLGLQYSSICVAFNVLLTLMIIARLVLHRRSIQSALGASAGVTGVYATIVVILTEACTPYAVAFLSYLSLSDRHNDSPPSVSYFISTYSTPISSILVTRFQVIGPLLIVVRIAAGRAVTSNMTSPENVGSIRFRSQETSTSNSEPLADGNTTGSMAHEHGEAPGTPNVGREADIEEVPL